MPAPALTLYFHPFSGYCQKAVIALYETATPFTPRIINLGEPAQRAELTKLWPMSKFPVLRDEARDWTVPESSTIVEYVAQHYPGKSQLVPADADLARQARMRDRFFDLYINDQAAKVVVDNFRPAGANDTFGVAQAKTTLRTAYGLIEQDMASKKWAMGDDFTMADCSAAPALFYANLIVPLADGFKNTAAYLDRLLARPSFARAVKEAIPYVGNGYPYADRYRTAYGRFAT